MLEKFKFWKHEEMPHAEALPPIPNLPPMEPLAPAQDPNFQQMAQISNRTSDKDLELISAKLDVLKAQLDNIMQRLERIERQSQDKQEVPRVRW